MCKFRPLIIFLGVTLAVPVLSLASSAPRTAIRWSTFDDAQKTAKNGRKYFIYFYTEQCGYCRMLEEKTFTNENVIDYLNSNYTPVRVNAGEEFKVASRFGIQGVPDLRFLSAKGEGIARWPGYIESERFLILLRFIHTDSYKEMNFSEFAKGQKRD